MSFARERAGLTAGVPSLVFYYFPDVLWCRSRCRLLQLFALVEKTRRNSGAEAAVFGAGFTAPQAIFAPDVQA